jgi:hypothetical protein
VSVSKKDVLDGDEEEDEEATDEDETPEATWFQDGGVIKESYHHDPNHDDLRSDMLDGKIDEATQRKHLFSLSMKWPRRIQKQEPVRSRAQLRDWCLVYNKKDPLVDYGAMVLIQRMAYNDDDNNAAIQALIFECTRDPSDENMRTGGDVIYTTYVTVSYHTIYRVWERLTECGK